MKQDTFLSLLHLPAVKYTERKSRQSQQHFPIWKLLGKLQGTKELQFTLELIGVTMEREKEPMSFSSRVCLPCSKLIISIFTNLTQLTYRSEPWWTLQYKIDFDFPKCPFGLCCQHHTGNHAVGYLKLAPKS